MEKVEEILEQYGGYLPLGTVVELNGEDEHKFMITSRYIPEDIDGVQVMQDYVACVIPFGSLFLEDGRNISFNTKDIKKVVYIGYADEEERRYHKTLDEFRNYFDDIYGVRRR